MFNPLLWISSERLSLAIPVATAAMAFAAITPAAAADMGMPYKASPYAAPVFSWTGGYVGGQIAFSSGKDHLLEYFTGSGAFTGFQRNHTVDGLTGGAYAGANYQTGYWVFGVEGDVDAGKIKGGWIDTPTGGKGETNLDVQGSLRGRIGLAADKVMVYGTGGAAFGNIGHTYTNLRTGIVETTTTVRTGWTAGAGVEYAISPGWVLRAEYRYTDYGLSRYDSVTSFPGLTGTQNVRLNTVRLGVAYKF